MNKIASVVFAYSPKNDDELELTVGDKIEVIGYEEEGWWKGKLRGRIGVFPSNFVEVADAESVQTGQDTNKLNSLFGSKVTSKNSLSSNSLNSINNNSNNNITSNSNHNLNMNNTQQHQQQHQHQNEAPSDYSFNSADESLNSSSTFSERRPKPLRGIGYGDIFAAGAKTKPLPADPTNAKPIALASERLSAASLSSSLQKPIPKKPPPPAPTEISGSNGSVPDQAPALPPKPGNQSFSPFLQNRNLPTPVAQQRNVREQAKVIYAYKPSNDDELEMEVGDIINIIDKNIEDQGWWKGEINGKIGVFPDNFVKLIEIPDVVTQDWHHSPRMSSGLGTINADASFTQHQQPASAEGKVKSVFAGTPKGFSKELESNLEKHSNPASFLSLKRSKFPPQMYAGMTADPVNISKPEIVSSTPIPIAGSTSISDSDDKQNGHTVDSRETSPGKLNHITANRAKGPSRRPPSSILNTRNQFNELTNNHKSEAVEPPPTASLPPFAQAASIIPHINHSSPVSLPNNQHPPNASGVSSINPPSNGSLIVPNTVTEQTSPCNMKTSSSSCNPIENNQSPTPKTNQRTNLSGGQPENKSKLSLASSPSTPPWMVNLRKTNAEKKRDPITATTASLIEDRNIASTPMMPSATLTTSPAAVVTTAAPNASTTPTPTSPTVVAPTTPIPANDQVPASQDSVPKQISINVTDEIDELRTEVTRLREDFKCIDELKKVIETIKLELRTCQSATESQRKYIKELVNNLADERKKIASMQDEIDRTLK